MQMTDIPATEQQRLIQNIMTYGTPAAKAEVIVKLIYIGNPELLQKVYDSYSDKELNKFITFA